MADRRAPEVVESVWDYPRPPALEPSDEHVRVLVDGIAIADSVHAYRVLETSHPPAWYLPPDDVRMDLLSTSDLRTVCEFKGDATYLHIDTGSFVRHNAAWTYLRPLPGYEAIAGYLAFYPGKVDEAWVGSARVMPQAGDFYGGWITPNVTGPFKGGPGTRGW
jgi:uncharacterized protein (DUF427 family)